MNPAWVHPVGWALVHSLWQLSILALCYRAAEPFLQSRPRASYLLGMGLLVFSLFTVGSTLAFQRSPAPQHSVSHRLGVKAQATAAAPSVTDIETPGSPVPEHLAAALEEYLDATVSLWLLGIAFVGLGFANAYERCRTLSDTAVPASAPSLVDSVHRCRKRLGVRQSVDVALSPEIDSPILVGWLKPRIILPTGLEDELSDGEIQALVAHELAHVKRRDYPVNLLQAGIERLFFFHPALRWLSREVRIAREHCCDDLAASASAGGAIGYARSLLGLEEMRATPTIALGVRDGDLRRRIVRLLSQESLSPHRGERPGGTNRVTAAVTALLSAALLLLGGAWVAQASAGATTILDGLDPTHLVEGRQIQGSPAHSLRLNGYRYLFSNPESMDRFRRTPERYAVRNADFCPITGDPVRPDAWRVVDGRILLFCCDSAPERLVQQSIPRLASPTAN